MQKALSQAVLNVGGQSSMARQLTDLTGKLVNQPDVWYWLNKSKKGLPAEFCGPVEQISGVPKSELRPDIFPPSKNPSRTKRLCRPANRLHSRT